jgi:hypothetical protein
LGRLYAETMMETMGVFDIFSAPGPFCTVPSAFSDGRPEWKEACPRGHRSERLCPAVQPVWFTALAIHGCQPTHRGRGSPAPSVQGAPALAPRLCRRASLILGHVQTRGGSPGRSNRGSDVMKQNFGKCGVIFLLVLNACPRAQKRRRSVTP